MAKQNDFEPIEDIEQVEQGDIIMNNYQQLSPKDELYQGILPSFNDGYAPIELDKTQQDLKKKANDLINDIINVYYKMDETQPDTLAYLEQYRKLEAMTLQNLLLQVKASEHVLISLLGRLNATGTVDNGLYKLITECQEKSIALTLQVSNYIRSLPTYFKQLRFELETNIEMVHVTQTQEMLEQRPVEDDPDNFIKRPQRGMRNFLKQVEEMENLMKQDNENVDKASEIPDTSKYDVPPTTGTKSVNDLRNELLKDNN